MLLRFDAEAFKAFQIKLLNVVRRRLHDDLELIMLIEPIRILAVAPVRRTAGGLHISDVPRLRTEYPEERGRVHRTRALLHVVGFRQYAAPV